MRGFEIDLANIRRERPAGFNRVILRAAYLGGGVTIKPEEAVVWSNRLNLAADLKDRVAVGLDPFGESFIVDTLHCSTDSPRALARAVIALDEVIFDNQTNPPLALKEARVSSSVFDDTPYAAWVQMEFDPQSDRTDEARDISTKYLASLGVFEEEAIIRATEQFASLSAQP